METGDVRKRVLETIERSRRTARDRRGKIDVSTGEFATFLERIGIPLCRQVAQALKAAGYPFVVNTPGGAVRLASERSDDHIELSLDTEGEDPWVVGRSRRTWGRRVVESERPVRRCPVRDITEDDVLSFLLKELEPFVER